MLVSCGGPSACGVGRRAGANSSAGRTPLKRRGLISTRIDGPECANVHAIMQSAELPGQIWDGCGEANASPSMVAITSADPPLSGYMAAAWRGEAIKTRWPTRISSSAAACLAEQDVRGR